VNLAPELPILSIKLLKLVEKLLILRVYFFCFLLVVDEGFRCDLNPLLSLLLNFAKLVVPFLYQSVPFCDKVLDLLLEKVNYTELAH
jgi:hypothetical protein